MTEARMQAWQELVHRIKNPVDELTIHMVGKYTGYEDSYKSLNEAVFHGGFGNRLKVALNWVEAEALESEGGARLLDNAHGILVPGGFGSRGTRGMMKAAEHARTHGIPYFGICYGFQWAIVEYAGNVCGLEGADSTEVDENAPHKVFVEIAELPDHPWYLAVQFHPEFQSRPPKPHPLFASFIEASHRHKAGQLAAAGAGFGSVLQRD